MHAFLLEMLQCPACRGDLTWRIDAREGERILAGEAVCRSCAATYPVAEGIGVFLTPDLPRNDLWEQGESSMQAYLREHPDVERRLMGDPVESLTPADQFFRAGVLEEAGRYVEAKELGRLAWKGLYTPEYVAATDRLIDALVARVGSHQGPIVDLASGRGILVNAMLERLANRIVMTDFSPRVLRDNRKRLTALGLYDRVSLLAFDARRTPFRDGAVALMTTFVGLQNIEQPGDLLRELRRVVSGSFMTLSFFAAETDDAHRDMITQHGMDQNMYRRPALENFAAAGWQVEVSHSMMTRVAPTPSSELFPGARVDGFPVVETEIDWCLLSAT